MISRGSIGVVLFLVVAAPSRGVDLPEAQARGSLRVIAAEGEQPEEFSFKSEGEPGFEREMLEGFARLQHMKLDVVRAKTWDERIPSLLKGDGDVIVGLIETEARRQLIDFTAETIPARHLVITHKPHPVIASVAELRKETVGVLKGTSWAQAVVEAGVPAAKTQSFDELDPIFEALKAGRIGATVMSVSDFTLAAKRNPGLEAGIFVGPPVHQAWGIRKGDKELEKSMNDYIENLRKTASWSRLMIKYFGPESLSVLGRARE